MNVAARTRRLREIDGGARHVSVSRVGGKAQRACRAVAGDLKLAYVRACAESLASENASRLAAMDRADRNIEGLLDDPNGSFHRLRQSGIAAELFDVISRFEAPGMACFAPSTDRQPRVRCKLP